MTIEQLRAVYNAQPFQPFVIHLADGRAVPVLHREFIMTVPSGRTIFVCQPDDSTNIIGLLLVTDLELKNPKSNGAGKRHKR
jgi:hypothetical protein